MSTTGPTLAICCLDPFWGLIPVGNAYNLMIVALAAQAEWPATFAGPPLKDGPVSDTSQSSGDKSAAVALLRGAATDGHRSRGGGFECASS